MGIGLGIGSSTLNKGGGSAPVDYLSDWIGAAIYADWSAKRAASLFTTSAETTPATASGDKVGSWRSGVGGYTALNATPAQRLNLLIAGTRYTLTGDGSDDNLLTTWLAASGGNTVFFDLDVPATLAALQVFFGSAPGGDRFYLAILTDGRLAAGVGAQTQSTIFGTSDYRGSRLVGALSIDGSTVKLYTLSGGQEYSAAQSGSPNTSLAARMAAFNFSGSPQLYFSGGIARLIPVQKGGLTLAEWTNIGPQLAAAGA